MRKVSPFAASLMLVAAPAHARFAPPLDVSMRLSVEQVRDNGSQVRRFTAERSLIFTENLNGYVAALTLDATNSEGDNTSGQMLAAGLSGLLHHTIRCRLDRFGMITGVDDMDALWKLWVAGMTGMGGTETGRAAVARTLADRLSAIPPEHRPGMLCSVLATLLPQPREAEIGVHDVTVPAVMPGSAPLSLAGQQLSQRDADGTIRVQTRASGIVTTAAGATGRLTIDMQRTLDPRTGLVLHTRAATTTDLAKTSQTLVETTDLIIR